MTLLFDFYVADMYSLFFRWLIVSPSNHNSSLCHKMNNIVQYTPVCGGISRMAVCQQWQYIEIPYKREFMYTDFHGGAVRVVMYQSWTVFC